MDDTTLEAFVEGRRQEADEKGIEDKAMHILKELGKRPAIGLGGDLCYKEKPFRIDFQVAVPDIKKQRYPQVLTIRHKRENVFCVKDDSILRYIPGDWVSELEELYQSTFGQEEPPSEFSDLSEKEIKRLKENFGYEPQNPLKEQ